VDDSISAATGDIEWKIFAGRQEIPGCQSSGEVSDEDNGHSGAAKMVMGIRV
jgi:hypothetical protein